MGRAQRTSLAALGILIGTSCIVAMITLGYNAKQESQRLFHELGTNILVGQDVTPAFTRQRRLHPEDITAIEKFETVLDITPFVLSSVPSPDLKSNFSIPLIGGFSQLRTVLNLKIAAGRFINNYDDREPYVILGATLANKLGWNGRYGSELRLGRYYFTVIGVLEETASNPLIPADINETAIIPFGAVRRVSAQRDVSHFIVKIDATEHTEKFSEMFKSYLSGLENGPVVRINSAKQLIESMEAQHLVISYLLSAVGFISLLVGGIGVANVMLTSVTERRQEIGLRMALGASENTILTMFLIEAALLSTLGGVVGALVGAILSYFLVVFFGWSFTLPLSIIFGGVLLSMVVGILSGLVPASRAAKLSPAEALRLT